MTTDFSVNVNKFALVRNSRGSNTPDLAALCRQILACGAAGITVHPRPDQRHIRYDDLPVLKELVGEFSGAEFNVEGYPCEALLAEVAKVKPHQVTLVPDAPDQLTSDHGWDCRTHLETLKPIVAQLQDLGCRVSLFLDPDPAQVEHAVATGSDRIELYTEGFAHNYRQDQAASVRAYRATAEAAQAANLGVNAGHDLSLENLAYFLAEVPNVLEVSIGHALVCESWQLSLTETLNRYLAITGPRQEG